jgi:hypothetical protein
MIVAFLNQKGDVGKTTLSLHVAGAWAMRGRRVRIPGEAAHRSGMKPPTIPR